jgi:hypothetical protein
VNTGSGLELDASNSRLFRSRTGVAKRARICWQPTAYTLSWGCQTFDGPHVTVLDPAGAYGVDLQTFFATHLPVAEREDHYVKVVTVRALQVTATFTLSTWVDGRLEMAALVPEGAYVVQNPKGEQYAMSAEEFSRLYEPTE